MRRLRRVGLFGAAALLALFALDRACPPDLSRYEAVGAELRDREGRLLAALPTAEGAWRLRSTADDVPPHLLDLLVAAEDATRSSTKYAKSGRCP